MAACQPFQLPIAGVVRLADGAVVTLASPGRRFVARLIDTAPMVAFYLVLVFATGWFPDVPGEVLDLGVYVIALLTSFVVEAAQLAAGGRSAGQRFLRLRVVRAADAGRVPPGRVLVRALLYSPFPAPLVLILCGGGLFILVDVLFPTWDKPLRQSLHDKVAGTVVIQEHRH